MIKAIISIGLGLWTSFALSEHFAAGQNVLLQFEPGKPPVANAPLRLPLTYAHIMSLGDLCGIVGKPITAVKK